MRDLKEVFEISQPAISQHLAVLRSAGLVAERKDGRLVYYRIKPAGLRPLVDWIAHYQAFWLDRVERLRMLLEEMDDEASNRIRARFRPAVPAEESMACPHRAGLDGGTGS